MKKELTAKQRAFVTEYMKDRNGTQAALRAGYSEKAAGTVGCNLLKNPVVSKMIADMEEANQVEGLITVDKIVHRLNSIAENEAAKDSDKIRANELLGKYLGMFTEKVEMKGQIDTAVTKLDGILKQLDE
jgi:phage terminase small subunit